MTSADPIQLSPDEIVYWTWGPLGLNATIVHTWIAMALLVAAARAGQRIHAQRAARAGDALGDTRGPDPATGDGASLDEARALPPNRTAAALEALVLGIRDQIDDVAPARGRTLLPFVGTLFLMILTINVLAVVPGYVAPTASLSTTAALAVCVFVAVPVFGIQAKGLGGYLRNYVQPTVIMLPFQVIGELSRTVALAVRLFGNMMSGALLGAILLALTPLILPVAMQALGLLTGVVQAYVFSILALIYIASAMRTGPEASGEDGTPSAPHTRPTS